MGRRFGPRRANAGTIGKNEVMPFAYYLYKNEFTEDCDGDSFSLFMKLVKLAGLNDKVGEILSREVLSLEKKGHLHKLSKTAKEQASEFEDSVIFDDTNIRYKYEEDKRVDRRISISDSSSAQIEIDLYRAYLYDSNFNFNKLVGKVFFDSESEKSVMASEIEEQVHDISSVKFLTEEIDLSPLEAEYLLLQYRIENITSLKNLIRYNDSNEELFQNILGITAHEYNKMLGAEGKLKGYGFVDPENDLDRDFIQCIKEGSISPFFADYLKEQDCSKAYKESSFSLPAKKISIMKNLIKNQEKISILLYGKPGSGKTECAKMIANIPGKKVYLFKNESESKNGNEALCRLNCFLSMKQNDAIVIVDEADTILKTMDFSFFGTTPAKTKGLVNKMLENNQNNTIWIINHDSFIDESTKRRFTYSCKFDEMPVSMLNSIAKSKLKPLGLDKNTENQLLSYFQKYTVTGSSVDNIVKVIESMPKDDTKDLLETVEEVIQENSSLLFGKAKMRESACKNYDLSIVNSSVKADKIVKMIENSEKYAAQNPDAERGIRVLFYGLSGTGKTELVRYISEKLGKKILLKRASDILGCYVGQSEKNIRNAFAEAERTGAILLFDEADSFFQDRNGANRSWEITQVNEFLTQMEEFNGILFCTTNLRKIMDPAMQRRFHELVEFKALSKEGITKLLKKYFSNLNFTKQQVETLYKYNSVTPGDFAALSGRIRFMDEEDRTAPKIVQEIENLQKEKSKNVYTKTAIGF